MSEPLPAFGWSRLAKDPRTSREMLQSLARSGRRGVKIAVGQNAGAAPTTLAFLAMDHDSRVRASLAGSTRTPPEVLATLAHDSDPSIRTAIAANQNTPVPALVVLTLDSVVAVRERAKGNPRISERFEGFIRACNSGDDPRPRTATEALACLVRDGGASTTRFVTERWALDDIPRPEVLAVLAHSPDLKVQAGVARNKNTGPGPLALLAMSKDSEVLRGVGANPNTPRATLDWLTTADAYYWRKGLPLRELVQREVAANQRTSANTLVDLARSENADVLKAVAQNSNSPASALSAVLDHFDRIPGPPWFGSWELRQTLEAVGSHPNAPAGVLRRLDEAGWPHWIVSNPNAPEGLLKQIAKRATEGREAFDQYGGADWDRRNDAESLSKALASNPNTPMDVVRELFNEGYSAEVAANPSAPSDLLATLASEILGELEQASSTYAMPSRLWHGYSNGGGGTESWWDFDPLEHLAANPGTPPATLNDLAEFTERAEGYHRLVDYERFTSELFGLRRAIAANPNTPIDVLHRFLERGHARIEDMPHAPADLKERNELNQDHLPGIRQAKARDHATSQSALAALARDELGRAYSSSYSVLSDIAENPNCPGDILSQLASHSSDEVRAGVARNSSAPAEVVSKLSADSSNEVRAAVDLHHHFNLM